MKAETINILLRLFPTLHKQMKELAKTQRRSLNATIQIACEQYIDNN